MGIDRRYPEITLLGASEVTVNRNDSYTDAGATVVRGTLSTTITKDGITVTSVDTAQAGTYTISYDAQDQYGNSPETVTRTVTVNAFQRSTYQWPGPNDYALTDYLWDRKTTALKDLRDPRGFPIAQWDVSQVNIFTQCFQDRTDMQTIDLSQWQVANTHRKAIQLTQMFKGSNINQDITSWPIWSNNDNHHYFDEMFKNATSFNQDMSSIDLAFHNTTDMFTGSEMEDGNKPSM